MTGFQVQPAALDTFAGVLHGGGSSLSELYVTRATLYVSEHVKLSPGSTGKIFAALDERTQKVAQRLVTDNYTIYTRLGSSATNLTDSATSYRNSDLASAKQLDAAYHPVGGFTADDGNYSAPAGTDPGAALTTPSASGGIPDLINNILSRTSWLSISGVVFNIMGLFGFKPLDDLNEWLLGDAEAVAKVSGALTQHALFDKQCSGVMTAGLTTMQTSWTGTAATAAAGWFDTAADALAARSTTLNGLAGTYNQIVAGIEELAAMVSDAIQMAIDAALAVVAALAAAGCLASIPGVNAIAAIIGASKVYRLVKAIAEFADIWGKVWTPHEGLLGLILALDGMCEDFDAAAAIPATAYSNGAQAPAA